MPHTKAKEMTDAVTVRCTLADVAAAVSKASVRITNVFASLEFAVDGKAVDPSYPPAFT